MLLEPLKGADHRPVCAIHIDVGLSVHELNKEDDPVRGDLREPRPNHHLLCCTACVHNSKWPTTQTAHHWSVAREYSKGAVLNREAQ